MKRDPYKLRDEVARPTLRRISDDRRRVCPALQPALEVIETRLFDPTLDVNAVWRDSGLNKRSSPLFKAELGETPLKYIGARRAEVAAKLVAGTGIKMTTIAEVVGYAATTDTFARTFESTFGMRPYEYREAAKARRDGETPEDLPGWMDQVGVATAAGDFKIADRSLARVSAAVRDRKIRALGADLGLACHERGARRAVEGDVDRAYDDLAFARRCYAEGGELPPTVLRGRRLLGVSQDTDEALLSALCTDCAMKLSGEEGRSVRRMLRLALRPIPRDLEWFEVCCDDCYRVAWSAVSRARAGLMDDAWKAWWLSGHADLADRSTTPSRGRFIAAIAEVERLVSGDQLERKGYCDLALADAKALGDPLLETQARIWRASVLRAMGELAEAREELEKTAEASLGTPWLMALRDRMAGVLESNANNWQRSAAFLRSAIGLYKSLEPHVGGMLLVEQAIVQFYLADYAECVASTEEALAVLDGRRDPLPGNAVVPINMTAYYALLGDLEKAETALSKCRFDRDAHPAWAAAEVRQRACLELLQGRSRKSVSSFVDARKRYELLHRPFDAAVAASYSVEAQARAGDRAGAIESAAAALSFFQAAGCEQDTLETTGMLRALLEAERIDVMAVTVAARSLARRHGGWLPEP